MRDPTMEGIEGTLPNMPDENLLELGEQAAEFVLREVQENFNVGGRPTWAKLATGEPSFLFRSGALLRSIKKHTSVEGTQIQVVVGTTGGLPYRWIHQEGGLAGRGHKSKIPARPYVVLPDESLQKLIEMSRVYLVKILNAKGETIG